MWAKIMQADGVADSCRFESNIFRLRKHSRNDAWFSDHTIFMDFLWFGGFRFLGMGRLNDWRAFLAKRAGQIDANIVVEYGMRLAHSARRVLSEPGMQRNVQRVCCCSVIGTLCPHKSILNIIWHHTSAEIRLTCIACADWRLEPIWGMTPVLLRRPSLRSSVARHRSLVRWRADVDITQDITTLTRTSIFFFRTWKEQAEPAEPAHREAKPRCGSLAIHNKAWQINDFRLRTWG